MSVYCDRCDVELEDIQVLESVMAYGGHYDEPEYDRLISGTCPTCGDEVEGWYDEVGEPTHAPTRSRDYQDGYADYARDLMMEEGL